MSPRVGRIRQPFGLDVIPEEQKEVSGKLI